MPRAVRSDGTSQAPPGLDEAQLRLRLERLVGLLSGCAEADGSVVGLWWDCSGGALENGQQHHWSGQAYV